MEAQEFNVDLMDQGDQRVNQYQHQLNSFHPQLTNPFQHVQKRLEGLSHMLHVCVPILLEVSNQSSTSSPNPTLPLVWALSITWPWVMGDKGSVCVDETASVLLMDEGWWDLSLSSWWHVDSPVWDSASSSTLNKQENSSLAQWTESGSCSLFCRGSITAGYVFTVSERNVQPCITTGQKSTAQIFKDSSSHIVFISLNNDAIVIKKTSILRNPQRERSFDWRIILISCLCDGIWLQSQGWVKCITCNRKISRWEW